MLESLGRRELLDKLAALEGRSRATRSSTWTLNGRDPDDAATPIAYEKGAAFLRMIEQTVGRERFDAWLGGYFDRHAFTSMTTAQFLEDLRENLLRDDAELEQKLRLDEWLEQPGLPANATVPTLERVRARRGGGRTVQGGTPARELQHVRLGDAAVAALPRPAAGETARRRSFVSSTRPSASAETGNSEVLFAWLRIAIRHHYTPAHAGARALPHVTGTAEVPAAALSGPDGQRLGQG